MKFNNGIAFGQAISDYKEQKNKLPFPLEDQL